MQERVSAMDFNRVNNYISKVAASETETFMPIGEKLKVGVDLGTAHIVLVVLDEEDNPVACEKQAAAVLRHGVVVDYAGALSIVWSLKNKLAERLNRELKYCAIAMPAGSASSMRTHKYVAEGAGMEVTAVMDKPTAANSIYQIHDGVVVDIGGDTTGFAIFRQGRLEKMKDEPTGGAHLSFILAGNYGISLQQAEEIKQDYSRHSEILPVVKPMVENIALMVGRGIDHTKMDETDRIYLCGGTCCLTGIENIFTETLGLETVKPNNPFLVPPAGLAMNCKI